MSFFALQVFLPCRADAQYRVSGIVEFSYQNFESKIGNVKTSSSYFTELIRADVSSFIWDHRVLTYSVGAGYSKTSSNNSSDSNSLDYKYAVNFFPTSVVSADIYSSKQETTWRGGTNLAGDNLTQTSFGGGLKLQLSRLGPGGSSNNNNNNNNNSSNFNRNGRFPLPDIYLSRNHTETEGAIVKESRDYTTATLAYRINPKLHFSANGSQENFDNHLNNASYDTSMANVDFYARVSASGELTAGGRMTDRKTSNIVGFDTEYLARDYFALLNFTEKNRLSHFYRYNLSQQETNSSGLIAHRSMAQVSYRIIPSVYLRSSLNYDVSEFTVKAITTTPAQTSTMENTGLLVGASYAELFRPAMLGPFGFNTSYDFMAGTTTMSGNVSNQPSGSGRYYSNTLGLGLRSIDWINETAAFDYTYFSKRDHSPYNNNIEDQSFRLSLSSRRLTRTIIDANGYYLSRHTENNAFSVFSALTQNANNQNRIRNYNFRIAHDATTYLRLDAGMSSGIQTNAQTYTLSNLPSSQTSSRDFTAHGAANFFHNFTRHLMSRAELREEYRSNPAYDTRSHQLNIYLDYRVRMLVTSLEYKLKQDIPDNADRIVQQYYLLKISRPF